jgi:hypothetical protein
MELCKNIHEANPSEKYIEFLLGQKDSRGRTAYLIAAETGAFTVLESPEVGTIVNKIPEVSGIKILDNAITTND